MTEPRFEPKSTEVPGPRTRITLDIAEASLATLLEGQPAVEVKLTDNGDGTYGLHGVTTVGTTRDSGVKPGVDIVCEYLNELADLIDDLGAAAPDVLHSKVDEIADRWERYRGERRAAASSKTEPSP